MKIYLNFFANKTKKNLQRYENKLFPFLMWHLKSGIWNIHNKVSQETHVIITCTLDPKIVPKEKFTAKDRPKVDTEFDYLPVWNLVTNDWYMLPVKPQLIYIERVENEENQERKITS
jgi:hypothetical protein